MAARSRSDDGDAPASPRPPHPPIEATDGRVPGRRGRATRRKLLDCTAELLHGTPWRAITVTDIARRAGTSPATFYQYFENVEQALLVLAEDLAADAGELAALVDGDWSEQGSWETAGQVVAGFLDYWERNRALFRVVELATGEGDLRFRGLRTRALNAVTVALARVISVAPRPSPAGADPMAVASTLVSMLVHVAAYRYGFEFWGIRTQAMVDSEARLLHWAVTGRPAPASASANLPAGSLQPRTGPVLGGGAAAARTARPSRNDAPPASPSGAARRRKASAADTADTADTAGAARRQKAGAARPGKPGAVETGAARRSTRSSRAEPAPTSRSSRSATGRSRGTAGPGAAATSRRPG